MTMTRTGWLATLVVALSMCSATARAADEPQSAYRLSFELDASLLLLSGGVAAGFLFMNETGPPACAPLCDSANINRIDRHFAGYYSESWTRFGDITTASVIVLVPAGLVIGEWSRGGFKDLVVVAEALLLTSAIQVTTSYAVSRPRPRVYGEEAPLDERNDANAGRSFFSGHVANCVAATMVANTALRRTGHPSMAWAVLGVGLAGSAVVGIARVEGGGHFPSDVIIGYAVGAGIGIALPALHERQLQAAPLAVPGAAGVSVAGRF
jgi:membrane-associated phospholipid phosphatase